MWNPSKAVLFFLMLLCITMAGIFFSKIDWQVFDVGTGKEIYRELQLPVLFFLLFISFVFPYVKKIKEEKENKE